ncbi:MAG TPA: hypothetical protein DD421_11345 [Clostridiaceae bacterium]|nr:hypothetical protein [Clostridiaceae bacterium]
MNLNKVCIEIFVSRTYLFWRQTMNLNKGCIEIEKMSDTNKGENVISFKKENTFDYVCSWDDGRPLRPLYVTKTFTKYVKRYGFKKITFHGLRHSHATILFANGASSHEISKRLRHSRVSTTDDIYIHVNQEIKKSTADIFSKAVDQVK